MNNQRQIIRMTESDLHALVEESVQQILVQEGWWGGIKNAAAGIKNGNFNVANAYKTGNWATSAQKYVTQAQRLLTNLQTVCQKAGNADVVKSLDTVIQQLGQISTQLNTNAQQATAGPGITSKINNPFAQQQQQ